LNGAVAISPQAPELYFLLARCYVAQSRNDQAEQSYDKAISYANLADKTAFRKEYFGFLMTQSQWAKALNIIDQIGINEDTPWLRLNYAKLYYDMGDFEKMKLNLDNFNSMIGVSNADRVQYLTLLIEYAMEKKDTVVIETAISGLFDLNKLSPEANYYKGLYNFEYGSSAEAKKYLELSIEYDLKGAVTENSKKLLAKLN
jgi:tetratricopeptide (TPR) repeat protein